MSYVRCISNAGFIYDQTGQLFDETIPDLVVGQVYKIAPPAANDGEMVRVIDESGEDYLYPADHFEPLRRDEKAERRHLATVYLDDFTKGVLHAEALAAKKSISALLREWIDERLDLPAPA
jgi:uncharacterized protein YnzC (UPF0291/DUF896 family)